MQKLLYQSLIVVAFILVALLTGHQPVQAAEPYPSYGTANVDGNIDEWDLATDFFADLHRAGKDDQPVEAKVYLRYDCINGVMYVLVYQVSHPFLVQNGNEAFIKFGRTGPGIVHADSGNDGTAPDWAWVGVGYDGNNSHARGFEASFPLPGNFNATNFNIHVNVSDGGSQTAAFTDREASLIVRCIDLNIVKSCPAFEVNSEEQKDIVIVVTNLGDSTATNLVMTDPLPANVSFVSYTSQRTQGGVTTNTGTCSHNAGTVTCTLSSLESTQANPNNKWTITIRVTPENNSGLPNTASVTADEHDPVLTNNEDTCLLRTPVTLSRFLAVRNGETVQFAWSTATETGNIGFNLYVESDAGRQQINHKIILSQAVDSETPQHYQYEAVVGEGSRFYIEDVDAFGATRLHGPFELDSEYGAQIEPEPIDWAAIQAEHEAKSSARASAAAASVTAAAAAVAAEYGAVDDAAEAFRDFPAYVITDNGDALGENAIFLPFIGSPSGRPAQAVNKNQVALVNFEINTSGLYRVTYEDLLNAGVDLQDVPARALALTNRGKPVDMRVYSATRFQPGAFIEFYAESIDTLYTNTNIYTLWIAQNLADRNIEDARALIPRAQNAAYYMETAHYEVNRSYNVAASNNDPWFDNRITATYSEMNGPEAAASTYELTLDNIVPGAADFILSANMWGITDLPESPDHHAVLTFNGQQVGDFTFEGLSSYLFTSKLPSNLLDNGINRLTVTAPGDTGAAVDAIAFDSYSLTYPRAFVAKNGLLQFTAAAQQFQVQGFSSDKVLVYRLEDNKLVRLTKVTVEKQGETYSVTFRGLTNEHTYIVVEESSLKRPTIVPLPATEDITSGSADLLIIAHPDFIDGLAPLVQARQAQGLVVRVVNVEDIYIQFNYGIFDPSAIRSYIAHAATKMGVDYVMLVGGDTYDYFDYLNRNSISFIPSLYAKTAFNVSFAPVDPLYADIDGDNVPDLPIGRLPVRSSQELAWMIKKLLDYDAVSSTNYVALFAADRYDGKSFAEASDKFITQLPAGWQAERAYLDEMSVADANQKLKDSMNQQVTLASFIGHSAPTSWTFDPLFTANEAAALTNAGRPLVVTQWGCWNTYYVATQYNTMGHKFMLSGEQGAAAVLGASTLTLAESEEKLGNELMPMLVQPGMRIGDAIQKAKEAVAKDSSDLIDVLLGWTLLGDPSMVISR